MQRKSMEPVQKICTRCGRKLVPIGHARANGADHPDWPDRVLHKRCYAAIEKEKEEA